MAGEVGKDDVNRLHQRIDEMNNAITGLAVNVAKLGTVIERLPALPSRPCKDFQDHIQEHKSNQRDWRVMLIGLVGKAASYIAVAGVTYIIASAKAAPIVQATTQATGH